jgi:transcriptional regulator with XRE-family HTH domain
MRANPIDEHFGARIRMRRTMLSLSQQKLADALGISFQQMQKYENGTSRISVSRLCAIADVLDVRPEFFFQGVPPARTRRGARIKKPPMIDFLDTFPDATEDFTLVRSYLRIKDAKMKRHIVALVQAIAGD